MFAIYWDELTRRKIPRMAYHVLYPAESAAAQADNFLSMFPGRKYDGEGPIVNDVELVHGVSKTALLNAAENFSKALEDRTGREVIVYSRFSFLRDYMAKQAWMNRRKWWMAQYTATNPPSEFLGKLWVPTNFADLDVWIVQTGERGDGPFYGTQSAQLDTNRWLKTEAEFRAMFGTVQPAPEPEPAEPSTGIELRVLTDGLRTRNGPGVGYPEIPEARLAAGEDIEVEQIEGNDVWIRHKRGWSAMRYGGSRHMEHKK